MSLLERTYAAEIKDGFLLLPLPPEGPNRDSFAEDMRHDAAFRLEELAICEECGCSAAIWREVCDCTNPDCGCPEARAEAAAEGRET